MNNNFLVYLAQASICQLFFYIVYRIFLKKETYFNINRIYLLCSVILSLAIPSIKIKSETPMETVTTIYKSMETIITPIKSTKHFIEHKVESNFDINSILLVMYLLGAVVLLTKFAYQFFRLSYFIKKGEIVVLSRHYIICTNGQYPTSSFFKYILWDNTVKLSEQEINQIINHEMAHINHFHTIDNLLMEMLGIVFWFNPLVYLFNKELKEVHEYIADSAVLNHEKNIKDDYEVLINKQILNNIGFQLSNNFNMSNLKTRIAMITKPKSGKASILKILIALPIATLMVLAFSFKQMSATKNVINSIDVEKNYPLIKAPTTSNYRIPPNGTFIKNMIVTGIQEGKISVEKLLEADELKINTEKYYIISFDMTAKIGNETPLVTYSSLQGGFTFDMRRMIKKLSPGDKLYFENVSARNNDLNDPDYTSVSKIPGLSITIVNTDETGSIINKPVETGVLNSAIETMRIEGTYAGKNLYIANSFLNDASEFVIQKVLINGVQNSVDVKAAAFEIDLKKLKIGEKVYIEIEYKKDLKKFKILNPEAISATTEIIKGSE